MRFPYTRNIEMTLERNFRLVVKKQSSKLAPELANENSIAIADASGGWGVGYRKGYHVYVR